MVEILKPKDTGELVRIDNFEKGCWVNITAPTEEELRMVQEAFRCGAKAFEDPLDEERKAELMLTKIKP